MGSFDGVADPFTDTAGYERAASQPLSSEAFWGGERGITVPLLYKLVS